MNKSFAKKLSGALFTLAAVVGSTGAHAANYSFHNLQVLQSSNTKSIYFYYNDPKGGALKSKCQNTNGSSWHNTGTSVANGFGISLYLNDGKNCAGKTITSKYRVVPGVDGNTNFWFN